jgi:hypothetical protein
MFRNLRVDVLVPEKLQVDFQLIAGFHFDSAKGCNQPVGARQHSLKQAFKTACPERNGAERRPTVQRDCVKTELFCRQSGQFSVTKAFPRLFDI